ncbi:MAG: VPLPA-CTERM sorting domain-containing protein [Gammaproteobacteria bacterium]|nr:VPLPA-CTERM sorting domain-containing protein [Gammaproteobacteria bacterium]
MLKKLLQVPVMLIALQSGNVLSAVLNVPGDFPNSFHMDLLAGDVFIDSRGSFEMLLDQNQNRINFDATTFDGTGAGVGTSQLMLTSDQDWRIADFSFFGGSGSIYITGNGTGSLIDNGNETGEWTLETPMYMLWNELRFDFSDFTLSSNATYQLGSAIDPDTGLPISELSGTSMSYETGLTYLVGQATITGQEDPNLNGIVITMGVEGLDPVSAVPVPAAFWLFGSGLIALAGVIRRKVNT